MPAGTKDAKDPSRRNIWNNYCFVSLLREKATACSLLKSLYFFFCYWELPIILKFVSTHIVIFSIHKAKLECQSSKTINFSHDISRLGAYSCASDSCCTSLNRRGDLIWHPELRSGFSWPACAKRLRMKRETRIWGRICHSFITSLGALT